MNPTTWQEFKQAHTDYPGAFGYGPLETIAEQWNYLAACYPKHADQLTFAFDQLISRSPLFIQWLVWSGTEIICSVIGHDWEDDSCIGPDSGTDAGHCNRCHFSFEHHLY